MKRIKRIIVTFLIILITVGYLPGRGVVWADTTPSPDPSASPSPTTQTVDPTPTPAPSNDPTPTPTPTPTPDPSVASAVADPSPTPSPCTSGCPNGTDPATVDQTNNTTINNEATASSDTGNNTVNPSPSPTPDSTVTSEATQEASPTAQPDSSSPQSGTESGSSSSSSSSTPSSITTGTAQTTVNVQNTANTNLVNSTITYVIENLYVDSKGNIVAVSSSTSTTPPVPVIANQSNTADITNTVNATSNSGINTINGVDGQITTGDAYTAVNVVNLANSNLINSSLQFIIINIFGEVDGNIILPEFAGASSSVAGNITQQNNINLQNTINALSNTGGNQAGGNIQTGNATTVVNLQNFLNFNLLGGVFYHLFINTPGIWNGSFLGWGNIDSASVLGGQITFGSNVTSGSVPGSFVDATQSNQATVNNLILASANTGQNTLSGNGSIQTGNAFTALNLINFINTNLINNVGYFGIINIMGTLNGNIGGESKFVQPESDTSSASVDSNTAEIRASGGQLVTSMKTNVGTHVNGGDTMFFFITVKNTGTGPVYDGKVTFNLIDANGNLGALQNFNIGKLNPGQKSLISFSLTLSKKAPAGIYEARELATGKVGPDNSDVSAQANTTFQVGASTLGSVLSSVGNGDVQAASDVNGGGSINAVEGNSASGFLWQIYTALGILGVFYIVYKLLAKPFRVVMVYKREKRLGELVTNSASVISSKAMVLRHLIF